jgi:cobalt-zinc-cadmium efflux system outer membrane protein
MDLKVRRPSGRWLVLLLGLHAGCTGHSSADLSRYRPGALLAPALATAGAPAAPAPGGPVATVSARAQLGLPVAEKPGAFAEAAELSVEALVEAVLARNPSVAQMVAAWEAASARYPQVTSLDDPMFSATVGPATIGSREVEFAYRLEISQKYPWCGKRALRGEGALAEANAAGNDIEDVRLQLVESARTAFYDYYLAERALGVNEEALQLLKKFRETALERFRNRLVPEQDVIQSDVELGKQRERQLTLERTRKVAMARINTLLNLPTDSPLPPPPRELRPGDLLPDVRELQARALAQRPDLQALADRVAAEEASLALAYKEYYPDVEAFLMYDRFMGNMPEQRDLAPMAGVRLNLPVRQARRAGAVAEAQAKLAQRQAELARLSAQVGLQVEEAYQQALESERAVRLYDATILPAARKNVEAALIAYTTQRAPFLSLLEAQRNLIDFRDRYYQTSADVFRRRASLERATGGLLSPGALTPSLPAPGPERPGGAPPAP